MLLSKYSTGADFRGKVAPSQDITVSDDATIKINPSLREGAVEMNLKGDDFISVDNLENGDTFVKFNSGAQSLELTALSDRSVTLNITGPEGDFNFKSSGSEFVIRDLTVDQQTGMLKAESQDSKHPVDVVSPFFAAMTKFSDRSTMLQIPSLNLNLKLSHFGVEKDNRQSGKPSESGSGSSSSQPQFGSGDIEFDYKQNGDDWPEKFPLCGRP